MIIDVDKTSFVALPRYVYMVPIFSSVPTRDYQGKSLEQIEKEYGRQVSLLVYWCACRGKDLTKIQPTGCRTKDVVEFRKVEMTDSIKVYVCANTYTDAEKDQCILDVVNINPQVSKQHRRQMVNDAIYKLFT
ncbi:MAG: hypothetical protein ABII13_04815 [Patescibacteria group bacterium]